MPQSKSYRAKPLSSDYYSEFIASKAMITLIYKSYKKRL